VLQDGRRLPYDTLVIATGSITREIPQLPHGMPGVRYLRTEADAHALRASLQRCRRLLVVGGGLIGLEVAASAAQRGIATTVLEVLPRVLARVCDEETAAIVHAAHRCHGVDIHVDTALLEVVPQLDGGIAAVISTGEPLIADLVVVGVGVTPDVRLAEAAGLATDDGIVIDAQCRTSDPAIFAAGDVARFPGPQGLVRLENWRHAQDQGTLAGRNAAGASEAYLPVPSFWSEQYDLYIQGIGWPGSGRQRVRRPLEGGRSLLFEMDDGCLAYATGINAQRDLAVARRLIERDIPIDPATLANPAQPLAGLLKR
jgi:3-phenylpropionate/trans-cinnamate dioxygenase ferredoxin reductase subunit